MAITLRTQRENQLFELSNFQKDSYVWGFTLSVRSGNFSATVPLSHYDMSWLKVFIDQLVQMHDGNIQEARLKDEEGKEILFKLNHLGHMNVSGRLSAHGETTQELRFEFITDQTCLKPFISDLRGIV